MLLPGAHSTTDGEDGEDVAEWIIRGTQVQGASYYEANNFASCSSIRIQCDCQ